MSDDTSSIDHPYTCPHCGEAVTIEPSDVSSLVTCPHCAGEFIASDDVPEEDRRRDAELDGMRVRQIALVRRAEIRTQSYLIVVAVGCAAGAAQCLFNIVRSHRSTSRIAILSAIMLATTWGAVLCFRKARRIGRELKRPLIEEPIVPPDFSELGDGSQQLKDLENLKSEQPESEA